MLKMIKIWYTYYGDDMKQVTLLNNTYEVIKDEHNSFDQKETEELMTDYFEPYDYVLGDYSYGKLRLKGFYDDSNKKATDINNFKNIDNYLENFCSYKCKYFIIKKEKKS